MPNGGRFGLPHLFLAALVLGTALGLDISTSTGVDLVLDGQSQFPAFSGAPELIAKNETQLSFIWSSAIPTLNYVATLSKTAAEEEVEITFSLPASGTVPTVSTTFDLEISCNIAAVVTFSLTLAVEDTTTNDLSLTTVYFTKDCRLPGCSETCALHGTCEELTGECHCEAGWFSTDCDFQFVLEEEGPFCPYQSPPLLYTIPEDSSTTTDWIGIYVNLPDADLIYPVDYSYVATNGKLPGRLTISARLNRLKYTGLTQPGDYFLGLFLNDGYDMKASVQATVLPWTDCLSADIIANFSCATDCVHGVCDENDGTMKTCVCDPGYYWYDCSKGCSGNIKLVTTVDSISDGSGEGQFYVGTNEQCSWLIAPEGDIGQLNIQFDYLDTSSYDILYIYQGENDLGTLIGSFAGENLTSPTLLLESAPFKVFLSFRPKVTGYLGWALNYNATLKFYNQIKVVNYSDPGGIVILTFACLLISLGGAILIFLFVRRRFWIIRASSYLFLTLIGVGCVLAFPTVFVFFGVPTPPSCTLRIWLPSLAFVLVYGCLFLKTWRIYRIFSNKKLKALQITDADLLKGIGIYFLYEVVFLLIWTFVDPSTVKLQTDKSEALTDFYVCGLSSVIFPILSLFTKAGVLIFGVYLSWKTRNVSQFFNESKFVGIAIYNVFFIAIVFIPLLYILYEFQTIWVAIACVFVLLLPTTAMVSVYGRVLYHSFVNPRAPPSSMVDRRSNTTRGISVQSMNALNSSVNKNKETTNNTTETSHDRTS